MAHPTRLAAKTATAAATTTTSPATAAAEPAATSCATAGVGASDTPAAPAPTAVGRRGRCQQQGLYSPSREQEEQAVGLLRRAIRESQGSRHRAASAQARRHGTGEGRSHLGDKCEKVEGLRNEQRLRWMGAHSRA